MSVRKARCTNPDGSIHGSGRCCSCGRQITEVADHWFGGLTADDFCRLCAIAAIIAEGSDTHE